jgi:hypothetical protein
MYCSDEAVSVDPKKIKTVVRWPVPKDKTEVRCFFRVGYLHEEICKGFCQDSRPHVSTINSHPYAS